MLRTGGPAEPDRAAAAAPTKRQRKRAQADEEERVRAAELRQLSNPAPQSALDFERLVRLPSWVLLGLHADRCTGRMQAC